MSIMPSASKNGKIILTKHILNGMNLRWNVKILLNVSSMLIMVKLWKCLMVLQKYLFYQIAFLQD